MLKRAIAFIFCLATAVQADALLQQYEAASVTMETEIFRVGGHSAAAASKYATWDAQRRADSTCALREFESLRGRKAAEKYVSEYAAAAQRARGAQTAGEIMGYIGSAHGRAKVDTKTAMRIAQKCGIGL